jgi:hypothetical protein
MTSEVLVDALPYIDQGFDEPGIREAALAMVEEENKRYRPTKNYLEHLPQLNLSAFETDLMKKVSFGLQMNNLFTILISGVRETVPKTAHGPAEYEAIRAAAAARGQIDGHLGVERVRGQFDGAAGAPGNAHLQPGADAGAQLRVVEKLPGRVDTAGAWRPEAAAEPPQEHPGDQLAA